MASSHHELPYGFEIKLAKNSNQQAVDEKKNPELVYTFYVNPPKIKSFTFKGGGARVFLYRKFFETARKDPDAKKMLADIKEMGGSSSGSIAAVFAAIHFEDDSKRTEAMARINQANLQDVMGDSPAWQGYKVVSAPLYVISKPLEWGGKGLNWLAKKIKGTKPGKVAGIPLNAASFLFDAASKISSPTGLAGFFNLMTTGGLYRGDKFQQTLRDEIRMNTEMGVRAILGKIQDREERIHIIKHLITIGLLEQKNHKIQVTQDVTFEHFYQLSKLPGSQFTELFMTAARPKDKEFIVFNRKNTPDVPIHFASRIAITLPRYYQEKRFQGEKLMDGGAKDNYPIRYAASHRPTPFQASLGITEDMSRMGMRVEYPPAYHHYLWRKEEDKKSSVGNAVLATKKSLLKHLTGGFDTYATDDEVTEAMQKRFAQRTLQVPDFGLKRTDFNLDEDKRVEYCDALDSTILDYFHNHQDEKVAIENYPSPTDSLPTKDVTVRDMPHWMRVSLLAYLRDPNIPNKDKFYIPGMSEDQLETLRLKEIQRLSELSLMKGWQKVQAELHSKTAGVREQGLATAAILRKTRVSQELKLDSEWKANAGTDEMRTPASQSLISTAEHSQVSFADEMRKPASQSLISTAEQSQVFSYR